MPAIRVLKSFETQRPWLIAIILYASTLYFSSNTLLLLLLPILFFFGKDVRTSHINKSVLLIVAFVLLGILSASYRIVSNNDWASGLRGVVTLPLTLGTVYLSKILDDFRVRRALYI